MLNKLLKYDLKYMIKNMSVFYVLAIFFAVFVRIFFSLNQTVIINILGQICVGGLFSMIANILINVIMRSWVRFRDFIYKDESYLTHTLPVTKNDIYNSKFIQTIIFFVISLLVILISVFIAYYTEERWILLKEIIESITTDLNVNIPLFIISIILILSLEIFNVIQSGFLGIILGYKKNNNKVGFSILFGFITYMLSQFIVLVLIFIFALFNNNIMNLFKSNILLTSSAIKLLVILSSFCYLFVIVIMNIVCKKEFNRGVNIE